MNTDALNDLIRAASDELERRGDNDASYEFPLGPILAKLSTPVPPDPTELEAAYDKVSDLLDDPDHEEEDFHNAVANLLSMMLEQGVVRTTAR